MKIWLKTKQTQVLWECTMGQYICQWIHIINCLIRNRSHAIYMLELIIFEKNPKKLKNIDYPIIDVGHMLKILRRD